MPTTVDRRLHAAIAPFAALAMLLPFLPTITKSVGEAAAKQIVPATSTTLPAEAGITFSCPVPGGGYTGVLVYPKDGSIFRVYEIVVRAGETEIYRDRWQIENMPPPPLTGLWPGVELVVSTSTLGAVPVTANVEVSVPSEPCRVSAGRRPADGLGVSVRSELRRLDGADTALAPLPCPQVRRRRFVQAHEQGGGRACCAEQGPSTRRLPERSCRHGHGTPSAFAAVLSFITRRWSRPGSVWKS